MLVRFPASSYAVVSAPVALLADWSWYGFPFAVPFTIVPSDRS